jgi:hypothetical protein
MAAPKGLTLRNKPHDMPQINPYRKTENTKYSKVTIPSDIKQHFITAIEHQCKITNLESSHFTEFNKILDGIKVSNDQDAEIELTDSFIKYTLWKPIRDIFETDITSQEIASLKTFFHTIYHKKPNSFVSCGK